MRKSIITIFFLFVGLLWLHAQTAEITQLQSTGFFKKDSINGELRQLVWAKVQNNAVQSITLQLKKDDKIVTSQKIDLQAGENTLELLFPDIQESTRMTLSLYSPKSSKPIVVKDTIWQPQKKWTIHCVTYSHHDLGYGDIPHRLRRENRMENMELMLRYCDQTDSWPEESKYRAVLETAEPLTSYLSFCNKKQAAELAKRINEGRIQIGGIHTTVNTETLGHEMMARLFYLSNRHAVDMFGIRPSISANFDDVIGITLPFFTYAKEAGIKNLFHGYNSPRMNFMLPAQSEPVFYMKAADNDDKNKVLVRAYYYSGDAIRAKKYVHPLGEEVVQGIIDRYEAQSWPFDVLLSQDGWDFTLLSLDNAERIRKLNETYEYPRMICSTMDMFFADVRKQADRYPVKTYSKDGNNQWTDQTGTDAKLFGEARRMDELIPTAEKLATIDKITNNALFPWTDLYQAYHRMLLAHEHTLGSSAFKPAYQYATEQQELRDMVSDAESFAIKTLDKAIGNIASHISTGKNPGLMVFNPMNFTSTQPVSFESTADFVKIIDDVTGQEVTVQQKGNQFVFLAESVPATGYKTYTLQPKKGQTKTEPIAFDYTIDNPFYTIRFDSLTGNITSLFDKELNRELVDKESPYQLNEYLYERYNVPAKENTSQFYTAVAKGFSVERGAVSDVVTIRQQGEGSRGIEQIITVYKHKKQIDFRMKIDKSCSGRTQQINDTGSNTNKESLYIALPFSVTNYRFKHSLPGMTIEPVTQQFDSVSTAAYGMRHFASVYNDEYEITVAPIEAGLIEYGFPRSNPIHGFWGDEHLFEKNPVYPENSSMFLYLLNNMFDVNISLTQPGEKEFNYSLTSGKIKTGYESEKFGWEIHNPLLVREIKAGQKGDLPAKTFSFIQTDKENVICSTFKPAEENGDGYILRLTEISGKNTTVTVSLPIFDKIQRVEITDLVENDQNRTVDIQNNNSFEVSLTGFGVLTLRLIASLDKPEVPTLKAEAISDMRIRLAFEERSFTENNTIKIYRDTVPDFTPSLLTYIGDTDQPQFDDVPVLNYGNWIDNVLYPYTPYYYKAVAYNRWNNRSDASVAVSATTLASEKTNDQPLPVSGLKAILVSDVSKDNYLNIHWRSNCEPDIVAYEIYRGTTADFSTNKSSLIGTVDVTQKGNGSVYALKEYDHQMFPDKEVLPAKTYYYKVCAVDAVGQKSVFTEVTAGTTKMEIIHLKN
jgi:hypothetical protein